jgi:hypothetical protein
LHHPAHLCVRAQVGKPPAPSGAGTLWPRKGQYNLVLAKHPALYSCFCDLFFEVSQCQLSQTFPQRFMALNKHSLHWIKHGQLIRRRATN